MNLFLDLDGPILDVRVRHYEAYRQALAEIGVACPLGADDFWARKRQKTPNWQILSDSGMAGPADAFVAAKKRLIESERLLARDRVWPEIRRLGDELFERHSVYLVTLRTHPERLRQQLGRLGIAGWFRILLAGPSPAGAERWCKKVEMVNALGVDWEKEQAPVFVGDTETDVLAAKALGFRPWAVGFGIRTPELLLRCDPERLFQSPADFAHALSAYLG